MFSILKRFVCPMYFKQWVFLNRPCCFANNGGLDVCNTCSAFICLHECDMDIKSFPWKVGERRHTFLENHGFCLEFRPDIRVAAVTHQVLDDLSWALRFTALHLQLGNGADPMVVGLFWKLLIHPDNWCLIGKYGKTYDVFSWPHGWSTSTLVPRLPWIVRWWIHRVPGYASLLPESQTHRTAEWLLYTGLVDEI